MAFLFVTLLKSRVKPVFSGRLNSKISWHESIFSNSKISTGFPQLSETTVPIFYSFLPTKPGCGNLWFQYYRKLSGRQTPIGLSTLLQVGGGLLWLNEALRESDPELRITLTDFYPNLGAFAYTRAQADNFDYVEEPVNALEVPGDLKGVRTQFLSLHHFKPADARAILQNAVDANSPIAVFEGQERSLPSILAMIFSPITVLLTTPFIRPFKVGRIIFTYLIPMVPLFVLWDGIVSSLRTYSVKEMEALIEGVEGKDTFDWEVQRVKSGPGVVLYLLGLPKKGG